MIRITGMILSLGLMVIVAAMASPAVAWDHDDDDDDYRRRRVYAPVYQPRRHVVYPVSPRYVPVQQPRQFYQPTPYVPPVPQAQPTPYVPAPVHPSQLGHGQNYPAYQPPLPPVAAPPVAVPQHERPGQFFPLGLPCYPHVRVKDLDNVPRHAVHRLLAVKSPDPRIPGCVYVKVCVPPGPCPGLKVKDRGARVELDYGDFEVEVTSERGLITIDYDD